MIAPYWQEYLDKLDECRRCAARATNEIIAARLFAHAAVKRLEANRLIHRALKKGRERG